MVERNVGQMSLADSLVQAPRSSILDELGTVIDWAPLRSLLGRRGGDGAGNSSYPAEVLLRCLLAGIWHNLSDPALESAIADRLSFRRFVGLSLHDRTPDHTTLWRFRQELATDGLIEKIFEEINRQFDAKRLLLRQGTLVDASLIAARAKPPRQAKEAEGKPPKPSADPGAKWGKKGKKSVFGYKLHTGVDAGHTIIRRVHVTDASVTDTGPADELFCGDEKAVYGDQAYYTHARHERLKGAGTRDRLMHRPNKHHPLTPRQKQRNKLIAKVRAAVERPYAMLKEHYGLRRVRFFSFERNRVQIVLACCAYNLRRVAGVFASRENCACG